MADPVFSSKAERNSFIKKSIHNNGNFKYNGIDRIDNKKGYFPYNVVPCCKKCNYAKGKLSLIDFLEWLKITHENLLKKGLFYGPDFR